MCSGSAPVGLAWKTSSGRCHPTNIKKPTGELRAPPFRPSSLFAVTVRHNGCVTPMPAMSISHCFTPIRELMKTPRYSPVPSNVNHYKLSNFYLASGHIQ